MQHLQERRNICRNKPPENSRYSRKTKNKFRSDYKGVQYIKKIRKWRARIAFEGGTRYIGDFKEEISAAKAYDRGAKKYFGEFACLNFPPQISASFSPVFRLFV